MNLWYFIMGYGVLSMSRIHAEAVLNLCMRHGIVYMDAGTDAEHIRLCLRTPHLGRLCRLLDASKLPYSIERRGGLPRLAGRFVRRPGLVAGVICAVAIVAASELFLFDIRVTGNVTLTATEVKGMLAEQGFTVGKFLPGTDTDKLENSVMIAHDEIAWLSVNIKGNVASVELIEQRVREKKPTLSPAHVVASQSGEVVSVELWRGNVLVAAGDQVQKGAILIAGVYDSQTEGFRFTRASGRVLAKTVHEFRVEIPYEYEKKVYGERVWEKKSLIFFSFPIKVFQSTGNCGTVCDKIDIVENYSPLPDVELPLYLHTERYVPYTMQTAVRDPEAALTLAYRELSEQIAATLQGGELLSKRVRTEIGEDSVVLYCTVTCIADIATVQEFEVDLKSQK